MPWAWTRSSEPPSGWRDPICSGGGGRRHGGHAPPPGRRCRSGTWHQTRDDAADADCRRGSQPKLHLLIAALCASGTVSPPNEDGSMPVHHSGVRRAAFEGSGTGRPQRTGSRLKPSSLWAETRATAGRATRSLTRRTSTIRPRSRYRARCRSLSGSRASRAVGSCVASPSTQRRGRSRGPPRQATHAAPSLVRIVSFDLACRAWGWTSTVTRAGPP